MANDLTQDPLIIDTAGAGAVVPAPARIYGFKYVATGVGSVTVKDAVSGHVIWENAAAAAAVSPLDIVKLSVKGGVAVTAITAARLYIYLGGAG